MAIEKVVSPRSSLRTPGVGRRRYRGVAIEKVVPTSSSLGTPGVGKRRYRGVAIAIGAWLLRRWYR